MKKNLLVLGMGLLLIGASIFSACTKEGPMGTAGTNGKDGKDGKDGNDGTTSCIVCHSKNQSIFIRETQFAKSGHATGTTFETHNNGECATCHTSQGFRGKLDGSYDMAKAGAIINNPMPTNCYTCHKIHETYTGADIALTVAAGTPITLRNTTKTKDFGTGNLCVTCHQALAATPYPTVGGPDIKVSAYYGLHHGTQGNFIAGVGFGLFEIGDGLVNSAHASVTNSCVTCHMADGVGVTTGGHTFNVGPKINKTGCKGAGCHDPAENLVTLSATKQAEIVSLLAALKVKLDAKGITKAGSDSPVGGTYPPTVVGAFIDYSAFLNDKSEGVHNPKYMTRLLQNLIAAL